MRFSCSIVACILAASFPAAAETIDLKAAADFVVYGERPQELAGSSIAHGDFDGDGVDDVAIGALGGRPSVEAGVSTGAVSIFFGGAEIGASLSAGLSGAPCRIVGVRAQQAIGQTLATGDFDGDGLTDLLIGSPWTVEGDSTLSGGGAAYVVLGRARDAFPKILSLPDSADVVFTSPGKEVHLGDDVALGDFDGDGLDDVAIGAMYSNGRRDESPHAGVAYLYLGRARKKIEPRVDLGKKSDLAMHGSDRDDTAGRSLVYSDWNGDGKMDLLVGAYYGDGPDNARIDPGEAHVVLGRPKAKLGDGALELGVGGSSIPIYGEWVRGALARGTTAGDLDGDGFGDVVVTAYRAPETGDRSLCGIVDVLFGAKETPPSIDLASECEFRIIGGATWDNIGRYVATGDLNRDGKAELFIEIPFGDPANADGSLRFQAGLLGIVMGRPKSEYPDTLDLATAPFDHVVEGIDPNDQMPMAVDVLDIDGDAKSDLVIGAPMTAARGNDSPFAGEIYFLLGKSRSW